MIEKMQNWSIIWLVIVALITFTTACDGDGDSMDGLSLPSSGDPFDLEIALELGRLCLQSYQMLDDFNDGMNFDLPQPFKLEKVFCTTERFDGESIASTLETEKQFCNGDDEVPIAFIATKEENIYVVFRGTDTIVEWIDDSLFAQVSYTFVENGGMTEQGFTMIYETIHTSIVDTVNDLSNSGNFSTLFVTGHSLGSALAILAVPELSQKTSFPQPTMYNFAGPRTGDVAFAINVYGSIPNTSWRVVNTNDLVPKLPPVIVVIFVQDKLETFFYEHVDTEHSITFGKPITGPTDFKDIEDNHIMCNYYNALCDMTDDPETCKEMAEGADDCNAK